MIRRFALLTGFAAFGAVAAFGSSLTPVTLNSGSCAATPGDINTSCAVVNAALPTTTVTVSSPPAGTLSGWSLSTGTTPPPPGIAISPTGVISGTPTASGLYIFNVTATYTTPANSVAQAYTMEVYAASNQLVTIVAQPNSLPSGTVGTAIPSAAFTAGAGVPFIDINGNQSYQWSVDAASAAEGLAISSPTTGPTAALSGTPVSPGTYSVVVTATDASGSHAQATPVQFTVSGNGSNPFTVSTTSLPAGTVGTAYSQTLSSSGGPSSGITWAVIAGTLPPGISPNISSGTISGTPTTPSMYTFTVQASYTSGNSTINSTAQQLSITVNALGSTLSLASPSAVTGIIGQTVTMQFSASGGTTPYTYSLLSGTTPPGLQLNASTGALTGTATQVGGYNFTIQVADAASHTASATGAITINQVVTSLTLPAPAAITGAVGQTVTMQFAASGGTAPYAYTLTSGTPPPGLQLNASTGAVTGIATTVGAYTFTIQASDSASHQVSANGTITITTPLTLPVPTAVSGNVGQTISPSWMQFAATGGTTPYTAYTIVAGNLPNGLTLNPSTGAITGQATQPGAYTFIVQATDSSTPPLTATATATITTTYLNVIGTVSLTNGGTVIASGGNVTAGTQPTVTVTIPAALPEQVTGTVSVSFTRLLDTQGSKEVLFSSGLPTVTFTIPAGSTQATFGGGTLAVLVGTAAGFGSVSASFQDALGDNVTSPTVQPFTYSITGTTPVIKAFTVSCTGTTYSASVIGYSSTLEMTNATFTFTPTSGTTLVSSTATVTLGPVFTSWFTSSISNQYGGQFMLTVPFAFTVTGGSSSNPIAAMTVTLTNSKGASTVSSPASPNPACQ